MNAVTLPLSPCYSALSNRTSQLNKLQSNTRSLFNDSGSLKVNLHLSSND